MAYNFYLLTLGCQMNHSDSQRIETLLYSMGFIPSSDKKADLIIVNSCSVRQKPIDRIWGKLKVWQKINPEAKKVLTGCVLGADWQKFLPRFDYCFKIEKISEFSQWLEKHFNANNLAKTNQFKNYLEIEAYRHDKNTALVPIMNGCNNFCSYCAVPLTRGHEWSRKPEAIIKEVRCLVKKGYKKIVLLGQNVCSYKSKQLTLSSKQNYSDDFVGLLEKIVKISGKFTISFMSPHPKDFSNALINLIANESKISKEIHLPMQSGDDFILKKMNRNYTANDYLALVKKMKEKIEGLKLSTDIIVGFPGENEKMFRNTLRIAKFINFSKAYLSMYSERRGTLANRKYEDNIPLEIKRKRWLKLEKLINTPKVQNSNIK